MSDIQIGLWWVPAVVISGIGWAVCLFVIASARLTEEE